MDNRKKIIFGLIVGIIFIIAFILNLLFPPKPFVKSAHADGYIHPITVTSGSLNQTIAIGDSTLQDWLEAGGLADDQYTYNDFMIDMSSMILGAYTGIDSDVIDQAADTLYNGLLGLTFYLDTTSGFIAVPNETYGLLDDIRHDYGFNPAQDTIGYWVPLPQNITFSGRTVLWRHADTFTGQAYVTTTQAVNGNYHILVAYKGTQIPGYTYWVQWSGDYTCSNFYQGSLDSGYYHDEASAARWTSSSFTGTYATPSDALTDFFGNQISDEPTFNGNVYLTDTYPPLNILDLPGNDGKNKSVERNEDINDDQDNPYGGYNDIVLSPKLVDIPNNHEYEYPVYPEVPHDLPTLELTYPEIEENQEISQGLNGLAPLWVTLLTMGGSFIVLKVIL